MHAHDGDAFDPVDLEVIEKVYWALCKEITADAHDPRHDELRKRIFDFAKEGPLDYHRLHDKVIASYRA